MKKRDANRSIPQLGRTPDPRRTSSAWRSSRAHPQSPGQVASWFGAEGLADLDDSVRNRENAKEFRFSFRYYTTLHAQNLARHYVIVVGKACHFQARIFAARREGADEFRVLDGVVPAVHAEARHGGPPSLQLLHRVVGDVQGGWVRSDGLVEVVHANVREPEDFQVPMTIPKDLLHQVVKEGVGGKVANGVCPGRKTAQ